MHRIHEMIGRWIRNAASETAIQIIQLTGPESVEIVKAVRDYYVIGNPKSWWNSFSMPCKHWNSLEVRIATILPTVSDYVYLIPEPAMNNPQVYRIRAGDLEMLIDECPGFEFSVVAVDGSWLLSESDHDVFFLCKSSRGAIFKPGDIEKTGDWNV